MQYRSSITDIAPATKHLLYQWQEVFEKRKEVFDQKNPPYESLDAMIKKKYHLDPSQEHLPDFQGKTVFLDAQGNEDPCTLSYAEGERLISLALTELL